MVLHGFSCRDLTYLKRVSPLAEPSEAPPLTPYPRLYVINALAARSKLAGDVDTLRNIESPNIGNTLYQVSDA